MLSGSGSVGASRPFETDPGHGGRAEPDQLIPRATAEAGKGPGATGPPRMAHAYGFIDARSLRRIGKDPKHRGQR
jgi:hypothetical protein